MSFEEKVPRPSDLGEWHRKKAGKFKERMAMDKASYITLQSSVRSIASKNLDKSRTARSQPPEVMEAIKSKAVEKHRKLLERYEDAWPVEYLAIAFIENHLQYKKTPKPRHRKAETDSHAEVSASSSTAVPIPEADAVDATMDVDDAPVPSSTLSSDSSGSPSTPRGLTDVKSWRKEEVIQVFSDALVFAAGDGFFDVVRALVEIGVDVDSASSGTLLASGDGRALRAALEDGHSDIAKFLLERGATAVAGDLVPASGCGYYPVVRALLDSGIDPNAPSDDYYDDTALFAAILNDRTDVIQLLLQHGATISPADLVRACSDGEISVVRALLDRGVDVNIPGDTRYKDQATALRCAIERDHADIVQLLLQRGATISPEDLIIACCDCDISIVRALLDHRVDVSIPGDTGYRGQATALRCAVERNHTDIIQLLLQHGATISSADLVKACSDGKISVVRALLDHGVDVNIPGDTGYRGQATALRCAIKREHRETVQLLLQHGATISPADLVAACSSSNRETSVVRALLDHGVDVNIPGYQQYRDQVTALRCAIERDHTDTVQLLLEHGAIVSPADLVYAISLSRMSTVRALLNKERDINALSADGKTLLNIAVQGGRVEVAELLLRRGADCSLLSIVDASYLDSTPIILALLNKGVDINAPGRNGRTALETALQRNLLETVKLLCQHGAMIPSHSFSEVCSRRLYALANLLLTFRVDVNAPDRDGRSALDHALFNRDLDFIQLLRQHGAIDLYRACDLYRSTFTSLAAHLQ